MKLTLKSQKSEREIFYQTCHFFRFLLLLHLLLPGSLWRAGKMTMFHHLLFELLLESCLTDSPSYSYREGMRFYLC